MRERGWSVRGRAVLVTFLLVCCALWPIRAQPPQVDGLFPVGGERGSTNEVTLAGKFAPWPPKVWVDRAGFSFEAKTNSGRFLVAIAADAEPGPRLVRFHNDDGASELRFFVVGAGREMLEAEPNNHFGKAQPLDALPITINGRLDRRDDVDSFAVPMRAGEWLEARADSYVLMSKVDLVLRLVTTNGVQLAWNHDFSTLDPRLVWRATNDGTVVLQCFGFAYPADSDIRLAGGDGATYRLHVARMKSAPGLGNERPDAEPNDAPKTAHRLALPAATSGTIARPNDEDRFKFEITKGEFIEAQVAAAAFGSPLDAWLRIETQAGEVLARNDDADGSADPRVEWKAVSNATYVVAIGSTTHRGGGEFCYNLSVRKALPGLRATLSASSLALTAGTTNEVRLNFKRVRGFTDDLFATFRGLPEGVTATTTNLGARDGTVTIKVCASEDAAPFQGLVQAVVSDNEGSETVAPFELTGRSENNGVPGGYTSLLISRTDHLWLTVRPKKAGK